MVGDLKIGQRLWEVVEIKYLIGGASKVPSGWTHRQVRVVSFDGETVCAVAGAEISPQYTTFTKRESLFDSRDKARLEVQKRLEAENGG